MSCPSRSVRRGRSSGDARRREPVGRTPARPGERCLHGQQNRCDSERRGIRCTRRRRAFCSRRGECCVHRLRGSRRPKRQVDRAAARRGAGSHLDGLGRRGTLRSAPRLSRRLVRRAARGSSGPALTPRLPRARARLAAVTTPFRLFDSGTVQPWQYRHMLSPRLCVLCQPLG